MDIYNTIATQGNKLYVHESRCYTPALAGMEFHSLCSLRRQLKFPFYTTTSNYRKPECFVNSNNVTVGCQVTNMRIASRFGMAGNDLLKFDP